MINLIPGHFTRPKMLSVIPENIPPDLIALRNWVRWRLDLRENRWTKVPFQPSGCKAETNNPATWVSFDEALASYRNGFDGIGFVFTLDAGFVGVDLDKCRNPETGAVDPWAVDLVRKFDTYTEISPSGTGLKLFARGKLPMSGKRKGQIEVYAAGRYFTVTGQIWRPKS